LFVQSVLGHIARETGAAALTLAHPSLTGITNTSTGSGSTAWKGTFRSQLYLETPKAEEEGEPQDPDVRVLRRAKANYARKDETIEIKWKAGVFISINAATGIIGSIEQHNAERVFLDLLSKLSGQGRYVSSNPHSRNYAPKIFAQQADRQGFKKADFQRAMNTLFDQKKIKVSSYVSPSRHAHERIVSTD
jgi:hypothetical protein